MNPRQIGMLGERISENYLVKKGYQILDKNYSTNFNSGPKRGEIDIVAKKNNTVIFVEIKTIRRAERKSFLPERKVDFKKQKKIIKTAQFWLMKNDFPLDLKWQIDVIAIEINSENKAKLRHFKNAVFC